MSLLQVTQNLLSADFPQRPQQSPLHSPWWCAVCSLLLVPSVSSSRPCLEYTSHRGGHFCPSTREKHQPLSSAQDLDSRPFMLCPDWGFQCTMGKFALPISPSVTSTVIIRKSGEKINTERRVQLLRNTSEDPQLRIFYLPLRGDESLVSTTASEALGWSISRQNWNFWTIQNLVELNHTGLKPHQRSWQGTRLWEGGSSIGESRGNESEREAGRWGVRVRLMYLRDRQKVVQAHRIWGWWWWRGIRPASSTFPLQSYPHYSWPYHGARNPLVPCVQLCWMWRGIGPPGWGWT